MRTVIVYKPVSDHARAVLEFLRDFEKQTGKKLDTIDPETREGAAFCTAHDILEYPTVIATDSNGVVLQLWRGLPLPTISEVSYYAQ
ncbi:MAG TPA: hypothetical protein VFZ48_04325 [Candidatus Saccharimonadales bacterium]